MRGEMDYRLLGCMINNGHADIVKILLDAGLDMDMVDSKEICSASFGSTGRTCFSCVSFIRLRGWPRNCDERIW